jgi:hypothetical protein
LITLAGHPRGNLKKPPWNYTLHCTARHRRLATNKQSNIVDVSDNHRIHRQRWLPPAHEGGRLQTQSNAGPLDVASDIISSWIRAPVSCSCESAEPSTYSSPQDRRPMRSSKPLH